MNNDRLKMLEPSQLPSLPTAAVRLLELSRSPDATIQEICETIRSDPAIAARVIKAANSSYFGLRREVTSIEKAACLLGPGVLTTITLTFCLANDSVTDKALAEHYKAYWLRVVVQAVAADTIIKLGKAKKENAAFLSGLLCDVGQLAMLKIAPEQFAKVSVQVQETNTPRLQLESAEFGIDHLELGVVLGKKWQLPKAKVDSIQHHHTPPQELANLSDVEDRNTMEATVAASAVADHFCGSGEGSSWEHLQECCHILFNMDEEQIVEFLKSVHTGVNELSPLFDVDAHDLPDPVQLISQREGGGGGGGIEDGARLPDDQ